MELKTLKEAQKKSLYNEIEKKTVNKKLYSAQGNPLVNIKESSTWLNKGNITPRDEQHSVICKIEIFF